MEPAVRELLLDITSTPTAAGREHRVIAKIDAWLAARPGLVRRDDPHGNIEIAMDPAGGAPLRAGPPVFFTAHMDHPAFVVERVVGPATLELAFRGGVMDDYFPDARVALHLEDASGGWITMGGVITGRGDLTTPDKSWMCDLDDETDAITVGDFATWALPPAEIVEEVLPGANPTGERGEVLYTNACDDLAALVAALVALDRLREQRAAGAEVHDTRVLLTRAEEIGFIGAIGASRDGFMPRGARIIALENSRSFDDSPIGGGPIVRVGDRVSVFSPSLTGAVAKVAERIAGGASTVTASQKLSEKPTWRWQRKLMAGGACEASVYCHFGYESTCVCLPLGNYHNMANLTEAQAGTHEGPPRVGREHVAIRDFLGMVELLVGCGEDLPATGGLGERLGKLWDDRSGVLTA
jgi:putative aminopeptidase FrvX